MDWTDRIGRRVRLRDLHIVLAVAESRSMSKASKALAISHPVVSKTISDLEITLGVRLFDRGSQGVELTSYGQALLDCGVSVFDELRQGLKNIDFLRDPTAGELRIGCPEIMIAGIVPSIVEQYSKLYPGVRLHVLGMRSFHELRSRNVELVISRTPKPFLESDLVAEALFDEPFVAVAGIRSRWTGRRKLTLAQLIDEPWVLPPYDSVPGSYIADIFARRISVLRQPASPPCRFSSRRRSSPTGNTSDFFPAPSRHPDWAAAVSRFSQYGYRFSALQPISSPSGTAR